MNIVSWRRAAKLIKGMREKLQFEGKSGRQGLLILKDENEHV